VSQRCEYNIAHVENGGHGADLYCLSPWSPWSVLRQFDLAVAAPIRLALPDSEHSIFEIEQLEFDLRGCGECASELSRMIRAIESPQPDGTLFGRNKKGKSENGAGG
jgi:hypothetical protein